MHQPCTRACISSISIDTYKYELCGNLPAARAPAALRYVPQVGSLLTPARIDSQPGAPASHATTPKMPSHAWCRVLLVVATALLLQSSTSQQQRQRQRRLTLSQCEWAWPVVRPRAAALLLGAGLC
jgi:hypothetical protein